MSERFDDRDRQSIRCDLGAADDEVRRLAVERIAALPAEEALAALVERLGDPSWRVRKAAVERLAHAPDRERTCRALVGALADGENSGRRNAALEALIRSGEGAVPILLEASADPDADVRKQVVDALAGIGDRRSGTRLAELLRDPDPNVRGAVADAIGVLGDPALADPLLRTAHDDMERLVRLSALRALARLEVPVEAEQVLALVHDPHLRAAAFEVLGHSESPEAFDGLLKGLESNSRSAREAAMAALLRSTGRAGPDELDAMVDRVRACVDAAPDLLASIHARLGQAGLPLRLMLIQFLGLLRDPGSILPILEAARDEALSEVACRTLARFGRAAEEAIAGAWDGLDVELQLLGAGVFAGGRGEAADACLRGALGHGDPALRAAAARALGSRGRADALDALVDRLHGAAASEGGEAESELAALSDAIVALGAGAADAGERATQRLVAGLSGGREGYRAAAARILGRMGRADDERVLGLLLSDPSPGVRRAAVEDLIELGEDRAAEPLRLALADEAPDVRTAAAGALASSRDPDAFRHLDTLARDADPNVRAAAVRAAGERLAAGSADDERPLAFALFERALEDDGPVAMALTEALGRAGGPEAARLASRVLERPEPELVQAAVLCVGRHGEPDVLERLLPLLSHPAWAVRSEAVRCLAERGVARAVPAILRRLDLEQDPFVREATLSALRRLEG